MSISEGDTVILPHCVVGYLHKTRLGTLRVEGEVGGVWDGYDEDDLICADDPLRVRVDTEQEARELVGLAEEAGFDNLFHLYEGTSVILLEPTHPDGPCFVNSIEDHDVSFSDRRDQVEAYLEFHSEEETMSDLTHEKDGSRCLVAHESGGPCYGCKHCSKFVRPANMDDPCPEHPDRQRKDDDDEKSEIDPRQNSNMDMYQKWIGEECSQCGHEIRGDGDLRVLPTGIQHKNQDFAQAGHHKIEPDEDDDDGEGDVPDVSVEVKGGEPKEAISQLLDGELKLSVAVPAFQGFGNLEQAIREYCELSEDHPQDWGARGNCMKILNLLCQDKISPRKAQELIKAMVEGELVDHDYPRDEVDFNAWKPEDGVCEWTYDQTHYKFDSSCGEGWQLQNGPEQVSDDWDYCPGCGREIEITTDEGGFECGYLLQFIHESGERGGHCYITGVHDAPCDECGCYAEKHYATTEGRYLKFTKEDRWEKVGEFKPDADVLERVNPDCNGSLFVEDGKVLFDPLCRTEDTDFEGLVEMLKEDGRKYAVVCAEATGIVLSFSEIADVSDE